jgi:response regulator of citrate/malate metabolism
VACSAALNADLEEDLGRLGVREFLHKPFRVEALRAALLR